jgi:hypothetical protein
MVDGIGCGKHSETSDANLISVGDYSAQAVVNTILGRAFPTDPIVGEEDAAELRQDTGDALRNRIVTLANYCRSWVRGDLGLGTRSLSGTLPLKNSWTRSTVGVPVIKVVASDVRSRLLGCV